MTTEDPWNGIIVRSYTVFEVGMKSVMSVVAGVPCWVFVRRCCGKSHLSKRWGLERQGVGRLGRFLHIISRGRCWGNDWNGRSIGILLLLLLNLPRAYNLIIEIVEALSYWGSWSSLGLKRLCWYWRCTPLWGLLPGLLLDDGKRLGCWGPRLASRSCSSALGFLRVMQISKREKIIVGPSLALEHSLLDHHKGNEEVHEAEDRLVLEVSHSGALQQEEVCLLEVIGLEQENVSVDPQQSLKTYLGEDFAKLYEGSCLLNLWLKASTIDICHYPVRMPVNEAAYLRPRLESKRRLLLWVYGIIFAHIEGIKQHAKGASCSNTGLAANFFLSTAFRPVIALLNSLSLEVYYCRECNQLSIVCQLLWREL